LVFDTLRRDLGVDGRADIRAASGRAAERAAFCQVIEI
jgi:hypothetical protein